MSNTQPKQHVGVDVWNNTPLKTLYSLGFAVAGVGIVLAIIASSIQAKAYDAPDAGAYAWLFVGFALIGVGILALIGAVVAHAVNWQTANR